MNIMSLFAADTDGQSRIGLRFTISKVALRSLAVVSLPGIGWRARASAAGTGETPRRPPGDGQLEVFGTGVVRSATVDQSVGPSEIPGAHLAERRAIGSADDQPVRWAVKERHQTALLEIAEAQR
jgi:hypothetical protein